MRLSVRPSHGLVFGALVFLCRVGGAQMLAGVEAGRPAATRPELERLATEAEAAASAATTLEPQREAKRREAAAIRERLREGDFRAGDRIILAVQGGGGGGDSTMDDTLVVRPGPTIRVLSLPADSLRGVLRSELQSHLNTWVTRFYKNASVRATPLVRFGVLGEVSRPGYYRLPVDVPISDAIMSAGGLTQRADMPRSVVRRGPRELLSKTALRDAMTAGLTLDQLGLDAGDELIVS